MAWYLYRLGRWSFRRRVRVLALWLVLLAAAGTGAATLSGPTSDQFSIPGIESVEAFDLIKERTPQAAPDGATARIVFQAPEGRRIADPQYRQAIQTTLDDLRSPDLAGVESPFATGAVSRDGRVGYATVTYTEQGASLSAADRDALEQSPETGEDAGLRVEVGGDALMEVPETGSSEAVGVALALVVLLVTFGSLVAAGMPLVTALVGVGIGVASVTALTGFVDLGSTTPILATMLGLAVGIDYALFIVSRYRHEIRAGREPEDAAGRAVGTAGTAVVFAGLTVVIALLGLAIVGIPFLTEMGVAAAGTIAVAVLIALTLLPALAGFAGRRILAGRIPGLRGRDPEDGGRPTAGRRWADLVTRRRLPVFVVGLLVAAVVAIPVGSMRLALPDDGTAPADSSARQAYDLISDSFGPGANGPLLAVVDVEGVERPERVVESVTERISAVDDDVAQVVPAGPVDPSDQQAQQQYLGQLRQAGYAVVTVIPESGPSDAATQDLVDRLRSEVAGVEDETGARVLVTGQTAVGVDVSESLQDAFPRYLLVVVGLAFVLLMAVFRSILVPLKAVLGFLVSVGVALGATVAVFQWGWLSGVLGVDVPGPVLSLLPLLLTGILFGLAMDYEVFLVSRMREEHVHGRPAGEAVTHGFQYGARVVTAAAAIMVGVFGSFAFSDQAIVKSIGFGLAIGILADAFLVRMTLVPAVMALLGERAWWLPRWLDRLLPDLDVEGERLQRRLDAERGEGDGHHEPEHVAGAHRA